MAANHIAGDGANNTGVTRQVATRRQLLPTEPLVRTLQLPDDSTRATHSAPRSKMALALRSTATSCTTGSPRHTPRNRSSELPAHLARESTCSPSATSGVVFVLVYTDLERAGHDGCAPLDGDTVASVGFELQNTTSSWSKAPSTSPARAVRYHLPPDAARWH